MKVSEVVPIDRGTKGTSSWKCLKEERRMGLYFKFFIVVTIINSFFLIFVWFLKLWLAVSTIHASYNMWKTKLTTRCDIWVVGCDGYPRGLLYVDTDTQAFQHWPRWCRPRFYAIYTDACGRTLLWLLSDSVFFNKILVLIFSNLFEKRNYAR